MSIKNKLINIRVACINIWRGHAFTFDPGKPTTNPIKEEDN